jgi:broad specificity phosphatase PhoE
MLTPPLPAHAATPMPPRSAYEGVWAADAADPTSQPGGDGESVVQVAARLRGCLTRLAGGAAQPLLRTQTGALVLVAHGDTLQILQALLEQEAHALGETGLLATHRRFSMATGELRRVC